jgi:NSS family neurotransmitter:Na+ symporter
MEPAAGPPLVFLNIPIAFAQLPGSTIWAVTFFVLLVFAALTSAISMLEIACSYFIDELGWSRSVAVPLTGGVIIVLGIPSALSFSGGLFGAGMQEAIGRTWFDSLDYVASNWMLPVCALGLSGFAAWKLGDKARRVQFAAGSALGRIELVYVVWLQVLRWVVPIAIVLIMLHALQVFAYFGLA